MQPTDQTRFAPGGNCLQAAIASLFELPLSKVPYFYGKTSLDQYDALDQWAENSGLEVISDYRQVKDDVIIGPRMYSGFYIVCGKANRGYKHAVVYKDGKLAHDPHPSRDGLLEEQESMTFVPMDISKWYRTPTKAMHPGPYILSRIGMSITNASRRLCVARPNLSNLMHGKIRLSPQMATKIERHFGLCRKTLLLMQWQYDLADLEN